MAKKSTVEILVTSTGDGMNGSYSHAQENTSAPDFGLSRLDLAAGIGKVLTPPATAKGILFVPGDAPDELILLGSIYLDASEVTYVALGPTSLAGTLTLLSAAGGTVFFQWC